MGIAYHSSPINLTQRAPETRGQPHENHVQRITQIDNRPGTRIRTRYLRNRRQDGRARNWSQESTVAQKRHHDYFLGRGEAIVDLVWNLDAGGVLLQRCILRLGDAGGDVGREYGVQLLVMMSANSVDRATIILLTQSRRLVRRDIGLSMVGGRHASTTVFLTGQLFDTAVPSYKHRERGQYCKSTSCNPRTMKGNRRGIIN